MEDRKRTVLAVTIVGVVLLAVLYSFGLNFFSQPPEFVMADPEATSSQGGEAPGDGGDGLVVDVSPQTVQTLIADLTRFESYSRAVVVEYFYQGSSTGKVTAQIRADGGWTACDTVLASGMVEHSLVGDGGMWLWYDSGTEVYTGPAREMTADLMQRISTYEDVLALDQDMITDAGYVERRGQPCVYVEAKAAELDYLERYWISVEDGLLVAAETVKEGQVVYSMYSYQIFSPLSGEDGVFSLPDGTVLHQSSE